MPPQQSAVEEPILVPSSCDEQRCQNPVSSNIGITLVRDDDPDVPNDTLASTPRNVTLVLFYTWVAFTGRGLWNQNCLATLVFLLKDGDPKAIGFLTAAMGMAQLCTSIPTGILADRYRRDTLLKAGALVGIGAVGFSLRAALRPSYGMLLVALLLWGVHWGIVNTSITALFSDSIPDGERSYYFTKRAVLINVANTCGPVIALTMFAVMGDNWTVKDCSKVLLAGNLISLPGLLLLCWMNDNHGTNDHVETDHSNTNITESDNDLEEPLLPRSESSSTINSTANSVERTADKHRDETYDEVRLGQALLCCCSSSNRAVPSLIATADVISGLASGMSIRYIAIFLYDNLHLSPVAVQVVYLITPILQVFLRKKAQVLAKNYGRCRVTVALKWIGITLMIAMVVLYRLGAPRLLICMVLIFRTCFMNSPSSLTKSVLMDHVPKKERAKWASLESVSMVSWSGSAALGGILVQTEGILFNFCFTAFLQFLATGPLIFLSFYDNRYSNDDENENGEANETTRTLSLHNEVNNGEELASDENCDD